MLDSLWSLGPPGAVFEDQSDYRGNGVSLRSPTVPRLSAKLTGHNHDLTTSPTPPRRAKPLYRHPLDAGNYTHCVARSNWTRRACLIDLTQRIERTGQHTNERC